MILLHWCLKNITFKKYKLIDLVNIMLLTAHHQNEKTQMKTVCGISWYSSTYCFHFHFCFGLVMTLDQIPFASSQYRTNWNQISFNLVLPFQFANKMKSKKIGLKAAAFQNCLNPILKIVLVSLGSEVFGVGVWWIINFQ